jgi:hypothetical protein
MLRTLGAHPVSDAGPALERIAALAPNGVDAVFDTVGQGTIGAVDRRRGARRHPLRLGGRLRRPPNHARARPTRVRGPARGRRTIRPGAPTSPGRSRVPARRCRRGARARRHPPRQRPHRPTHDPRTPGLRSWPRALRHLALPRCRGSSSPGARRSSVMDWTNHWRGRQTQIPLSGTTGRAGSVADSRGIRPDPGVITVGMSASENRCFGSSQVPDPDADRAGKRSCLARR